jgi:y4mF family transcriptional regulator
MITPETWGQAIRRARKRQGLTQEQFAGLLGTGTRFVSDLERGKTTIQLGKALAAAQLLGLEPTLVPRSALAAVEDILGASSDD